MNKNLYDKLKTNENESLVVCNDFIVKLVKCLYYFTIIFGIFMCYIIIKQQYIGIYKYLIIPFYIFFIIVFKNYVKQIVKENKNFKFKINKNNMSFYCGNNLIEIPTKQIKSIKDKSFYYDFNGNGPFNKGYHHVLAITILNNNIITDTLKNNFLKYEISENNIILELESYAFGNLKHKDYLKLIENIQSFCNIHC